MLCSFTSSLFAWGFYYAYGVFFSDLQTAFQANRAEISIVSSICICTIFVAGLFYGWILDRIGPRLPLGLSGITICIGLFIASRAGNLWQLYLSMGFLVGFGISSTAIIFTATLARWFVKRRGFVIGVQSAGVGAGMMTIAPLSQYLLTNHGWRNTFVIYGIVCLVVFSIAAYFIRGDPSEKGLLPYGVIPDDTDTATKITSSSPHTTQDVTIKQALKSRELWLIMGIKMVLSLVMFMVNTHLVNFAKDSGMAATSAAMLMTIVGGVSIASKIEAGHLADKLGSRSIVIACGAIMAALMFYFASPIGAKLLPVSAVIYGIAYGGSFIILNIIVTETYGLKQLGKLLAFVNLTSAIGSLIGPWLGGYIFDSTGSYSIAFMVTAVCGIAAIILAIPFGKQVQKRT